MIYQITAILIVLIFYTFYFAKIMIQKKQSIKTNQMGMGNKSKKVLWIEPKTYHQFVKKDLYSYFRSFDLEVEKEIHCNYSRVLILKKNTSIS